MLVVFAANFTVFCHCAARAEILKGHHSCCEKMACADSPRRGLPEGSKHSDCQGMQSVRFNLVEKQVSSPVAIGEPLVTVLTIDYVEAPVATVEKGFRRNDWWVYRYGPPDLQVLYSNFRI